MSAPITYEDLMGEVQVQDRTRRADLPEPSRLTYLFATSDKDFLLDGAGDRRWMVWPGA